MIVDYKRSWRDNLPERVGIFTKKEKEAKRKKRFRKGEGLWKLPQLMEIDQGWPAASFLLMISTAG